MRRNGERGDFIEWLLMLLALSVVIFAILIPKTGRNFFIGLPNFDGGWYGASSQDSERAVDFPSLFSDGSIRLGVGNARHSMDPMDEYITIDNNSSTPINITGWRLENGKNARTYTFGGQTLQYASDTAIIPQGTKMISPTGRSSLGNIILEPGEKANIISGGPGNISPYTIVSFKETSCTGYLKEDYFFPSGLERSCVRPSNEPGVTNLDTQCRNFISSMSSCHTPEFGGRDSSGEICRDCIDGRVGLSSVCGDFIRTHYSYAGCIANHANDADFEGRVWHVYLHRPWEMWARDYETIYLYDSSGGLVTSLSY